MFFKRTPKRKKNRPLATPVVAVIALLACSCCIVFLYRYYGRQMHELSVIKRKSLNLVNSWNAIQQTTKDLIITEDLTSVRKQWSDAIVMFDTRLMHFINARMIREISRSDDQFAFNIQETKKLWQVVKPRIEYIQVRFDEYLSKSPSSETEERRSLLHELMYQMEREERSYDYVTLFDLSYDIQYMVSSLNEHFVSVLNSTIEMIFSRIDAKAEHVRKTALSSSLILAAVTILFVLINQRTMRRSQVRFQHIVEMSPFPIAVITPAGYLDYINTQFVRMFGYTLEDIPTSDDWARKAFPDESYRRKVLAEWGTGPQQQSGSEDPDREFIVTCKDGRLRHIIFNKLIMEDKNLFVLMEDITERKLAAESLRESQQRFKAIFDQTYQFMGLMDPQGNLLAANRTALDFIQADEAEVFGKPFWETPWWLHSSEDRGKVREAIREASTGIFKRFEVIQRRSDGKVLFFDFSIKPVFNEEQHVVMLIPEGRDITERKKAEEERVRLSSVVEQAHEMVVIMDVEGYITYMNPATTRLMGYTTGEVIGSNPFVKIKGVYSSAYYKEIWSTVYGGRSWHGRLRNKTKDGRFLEVETSIFPIRDKTETIISYVSIGRDVTNEVKLQEQLRQAQKMEAIGTLAGGIAHDFNNILGAIIGYIELALLDIPDDSNAVGKLQQSLRSSYRARDLVKQILSFSRQAGHEKQPMHVGLIAEESVKFLRASLPSSITLDYSCTAERDIVLTDQTQMHQILLNLCSNAAHAFRNNHGVIEISLENLSCQPGGMDIVDGLVPGDDYLHIVVRDNGHGISPDIRDRIFDPYFTTKKTGEGTGLGLSVVHGIVVKHKGIITVESETDTGTAFHIYLPTYAGDLPAVTKQEDAIPSGTERILVVDDEQDLVSILKEMLESLGYTVSAITDAEKALEVFRSEPDAFDLVITDKTMPHMTGFDLTQHITAIRDDTPVILCTGYSESYDSETAERAGVKEVIIKPLIMRDIAVSVRKVLDSV